MPIPNMAGVDVNKLIPVRVQEEERKNERELERKWNESKKCFAREHKPLEKRLKSQLLLGQKVFSGIHYNC